MKCADWIMLGFAAFIVLVLFPMAARKEAIYQYDRAILAPFEGWR